MHRAPALEFISAASASGSMWAAAAIGTIAIIAGIGVAPPGAGTTGITVVTAAAGTDHRPATF